MNVESGKILQRDCNLITQGRRMTQDFVAFSKKSADTKALPLEIISNLYALMVKNSGGSTNNRLANLKIQTKKPT